MIRRHSVILVNSNYPCIGATHHHTNFPSIMSMLRTMPPRTAMDAEMEAAKALSTSMGISSGAARSYTARDLPGVDEVTMFQCSIGTE